jgi:hypothetical protein
MGDYFVGRARASQDGAGPLVCGMGARASIRGEICFIAKSLSSAICALSKGIEHGETVNGGGAMIRVGLIVGIARIGGQDPEASGP